MVPPLILISAILRIAYGVIGIPGNLVSGAVFLRKNMRGPYTGLVVGLAAFDILLSISVIFYIWVFWTHSSQELIPTIFVPFAWISSVGSKYFTLAIAAERFYVVSYPLHAYKTRKTRGLWMTCFVVGFIAIVAVFSFTYYKFMGPGYAVLTTSVQLIPLPGVVLLSVALYQRLQQAQADRRTLTGQEREGLSMTRTMLAVTIVFGICCSLDFLCRILNSTGHLDPQHLENTYSIILFHLSAHFYMINSNVNFIIYGAMSKRFRLEAKDMFACSRGGKRATTTISTPLPPF